MILTLHDAGPYYSETNPLICSANQWTFFFKLGFIPCKAKQPQRGMELQERKHKEDYRIQKICLERI